MREALIWSLVWIGTALAFNVLIWWTRGAQSAEEFLLGYVIEKSLSVDNLFVFLMVFSYFRVPSAYQHRVLFWGILGALVMRGLFIAVGVALIRKFHWMIFVFGGLLIVSGIKLMVQKDHPVDPNSNPVVRLFRRWFPTTDDLHGASLFIVESGRVLATPLFVVLLVIESSDVVFALDSIPAIFGVTNDAFIIYTSNVFAILGLRSLYFLLVGMLDRFHHLKPAICLVLVLVGVKMLLTDVFPISSGVSLVIVGSILAAGVIASLVSPSHQSKQAVE